jgi:uncharacterized repeat protein (TIGR01451 family)
MKSLRLIGILMFLLVTVGTASADLVLTEADGIHPGNIQVDVTYNRGNSTVTFLDRSTGVNNGGIAGIGYNLDVDAVQITGYTANSNTGQVLYDNANSAEQDANRWTGKNNSEAEDESGNLLRFYSGDTGSTGRFQKIVVKLPSFNGNIPADSRNNQVGARFVCDQFTTFIAGPGNGGTTTESSALNLETTALSKTYDTAGQEISYNYVVKNTGNVPITGLSVQDDKLGTVSVPSTALEPGQVVSVLAVYMITPADLDAGSVINTAYAKGTYNGNEIKSNDATAMVTADKPALKLEESALPATYDAAGQTITYTYKVTNSGNVKISGPITFTDNLTNKGIPLEISKNDLAVGDQIDFTKSYTTTDDDLNAGSVINAAYATGAYNNKQVKSNDATSTVAANESAPVSAAGKLNSMDLEFNTNTINSDVEIPEFPSIVLPVMAILGLLFILQGRRKER